MTSSSSAVTLDCLEPRSTQTTTLDNHLYFPVIPDQEDPLLDPYANTTDNQPRQILKDRLYVGSLHPSVDEYTLLQVFSKFGKVTKLDFLFHKTGLLKGKPRGYAFVEYGNKDDALKALTMAHERPLRGRKLIVTFAHQAPLDQYNGSGSFSSSKNRKTMMDIGRPTTLSMLKTGFTSRHEGKIRDKIAMMEAKLRQMESTNPKPAKPVIALPDMDIDLEGITLPQIPSASSSSLPPHPSLPMKPPPTIPEYLRPNQPTQSQSRPSLKEKSLLPPLPLPASIPPPLQGQREKIRDLVAPSRSGKPMKLIGVKVKAKPKEKETEK